MAPTLASRVTPWKRIRGLSDVSDFRLPPPTLYSVGGTISGLGTGLSVLLRNSVTGENLSRNANGAWSFVTQQATGASYDVSVQTQPNGQTCSVSNGGGNIGNGNVGNVDVSCSTIEAVFANGFE